MDFVLRKSIEQLAAEGVIERAVLPQRHAEFKAIDASDVFDHCFKIRFSNSKNEVEVWGQTTCYKGNELGVPEANKTYEIRETLIEALTLRRHLIQKGGEFRVVHFTFGPSAYTYGWFEGAKANAFDWSVYSSDIVPDYDIFPDLITLLTGSNSEADAYERLEKCLTGPVSQLKEFVEKFIGHVAEWLSKIPEKNTFADKQAGLLNGEYFAIKSQLPAILQASKNGGESIKGKVLEVIASGTSSDSHVAATLERIYQGNGFISKALEALKNWGKWEKDVLAQVDDALPLNDAINLLWNIGEGDFYITRRLLVRLFSAEGVHYPADLNIRGVTEHTLYTVKYPEEQNAQIIRYLSDKYTAAGIKSTTELKKLLLAPRVKQIVVDALKHDTSNGTNLKPSFYYLEEALKDDFDFVSFEEANLPLPVGYQINFAGGATVQPYGNLKVVVDKKGLPKAIIKAKYFRKQEFPRRVKEEAYVGLTTKYELNAKEFSTRYKLPFIMFVDMDTNLVPPEFAVVRLTTTGWLPFFKVEEIRKFLKSLK